VTGCCRRLVLINLFEKRPRDLGVTRVLAICAISPSTVSFSAGQREELQSARAPATLILCCSFIIVKQLNLVGMARRDPAIGGRKRYVRCDSSAHDPNYERILRQNWRFNRRSAEPAFARLAPVQNSPNTFVAMKCSVICSGNG
jgi:hypothetical protein